MPRTRCSQIKITREWPWLCVHRELARTPRSSRAVYQQVDGDVRGCQVTLVRVVAEAPRAYDAELRVEELFTVNSLFPK